MNKILKLITIFFSSLSLVIIIFSCNNSNGLKSHQACFEFYFDHNIFDADEFFKLPDGIFNKEEHVIICKLPLKVNNSKASNFIVKTNITSINCNENYINGKHIKYESYELTEKKLEVFVIDKRKLKTLKKELEDNSILAKRTLKFYYEKGRINRLLITHKSVTNYCNFPF